jgi:predicted transport protein
VKNRLSWNYDAFNKGRVHVAKMDAKAKTLYLYLALDPAQFVDTKYAIVDVSAKRKYASTPTLIKIKGERKFKHALELIEKLCGEQLQLVKTEGEAVDYRIERMTMDEMVEAGLMKKSAGYVVLMPETEPAAEVEEAIPADAQVEAPAEEN